MPTLFGLTRLRISPTSRSDGTCCTKPDRDGHGRTNIGRRISIRESPIRSCCSSTGSARPSAYLRSDTLQRHDVSDRRTPLLEEAERQLKARLQQYYEHVERRDYLAPEQKTPRPAAPSGSAGALPDPQNRSRDIGCPPIFTRRPSRMLFAETGNAPGKKPLFRNILCRRAKAETKIGNRRYAPYRKTDGPLP